MVFLLLVDKQYINRNIFLRYVVLLSVSGHTLCRITEYCSYIIQPLFHKTEMGTLYKKNLHVHNIGLLNVRTFSG